MQIRRHVFAGFFQLFGNRGGGVNFLLNRRGGGSDLPVLSLYNLKRIILFLSSKGVDIFLNKPGGGGVG